MDDRLLLRVEEAAKLLGVGRSKAWELIWARDLPVIRIGRLVRIPRSELERWITERTEAA